jgi:hypothetical protein
LLNRDRNAKFLTYSAICPIFQLLLKLTTNEFSLQIN